MKIRNKICLIISLFITILTTTSNVYAASASSISISSAKVNSKVTVSISVKNVNTVDLTATISGAGTNGKIRIVDGNMSGDKKTFTGSAVVTPTTTGTITVTISSDSNAVRDGQYIDVSGKKSVTVKKASTSSSSSSSQGNSTNNSTTNSSTNQSTNNTTTQKVKSSENNLTSLSISQGTLSPAFDAKTTSYKVNLTSDIQKIKLEAKAKDSKAKVTGTGEKELRIGENNYTVTVVAENGTKKTYTVSVYVTEKPTVFVTFDNIRYGVLSHFSKISLPKGFEPSTQTVDGQEITSLKNSQNHLELLMLQNMETNNVGFYIYENNEVLCLYQTITVNGVVYTVLPITQSVQEEVKLNQTTITINETEIPGWNFNGEKANQYYLTYLMNAQGERNLYSYETSEGTLQKYVAVENSGIGSMAYIFIATTILFAFTTIISLIIHQRFKNKSIAAIKSYYDKKHMSRDENEHVENEYTYTQENAFEDFQTESEDDEWE